MVTAITERLGDYLERREKLPSEVAPAMGWSGPEDAAGSLGRRLFDTGRLDIIDQGDLLTSHSGMKYPDQRLFEEIYVDEVMGRIQDRTGFGEYS